MTSPVREFDYVVVGLGGVGSAAAWWLSRRAGGDAVLGLERFQFGHERGASEDHSRIVRLSYHTPGYVDLARHALEAWAELEAASGETLIHRTGGLDLGPAGGAIPLEDYEQSMVEAGVGFERLDAAEIMRRWPAWRLSEDVRGLFQEDAGFAAASACNRAHRRLATEAGATLRERSPVTGLRAAGGEVEIEAGDERFRCRRVVLAADAWTNDLLAHLGTRLPLTVTKEQVLYLGADPERFAPARFPVWIWMDEPSFYGIPAFGGPGPKIGQDCGGRPVDPDRRTFDEDEAARDRSLAFVDRYLPEMRGPLLAARTCLYTLTPDRDFVLDAVPGHPEVLLGLGAAHGFKFASLFGRVLADLAVDGRTAFDLSPFRADRPLLTMEDPPTSWMV